MMKSKLLRGTLIFVDGFAAVSALFGGLELETGWPTPVPDLHAAGNTLL